MAVKYIDIVHHSHTDFGFTDHQVICRELHKRYIGMALDSIKATSMNPPGERFCWTAETIIPVFDWWEENKEKRGDEFLKALKSGQLEITGFPFNVTSFANEDEWDKMLNWIPEELWDLWGPVSIMQNDVNGLPCGAVMKAINKGLDHLWIGPNTFNAVPPFATPSAFRWRMPNGSSIFVWLNSGYNDGFFMFNENWRQGPVPSAADLRYRKPEKGDIWCSDETRVLEAHKRCLQNLKLLENTSEDESSTDAVRDGFTLNRVYGGYDHERLLVSVTGQWRMDNDPPFEPLADFVKQWNRMGLSPVLRLTTASEAMKDLEREIGDKLIERSGEWVDWWANGNASLPVETAVSRKAKRILKAIKSPVFKSKSDSEEIIADRILRDLCMFEEHSYGSWDSIADPFSILARGAASEKNLYAYRAYAQAEYLLSEKARRDLTMPEDGIYVINTAPVDASGWIELPVNCLRGEYDHVRNTVSGEICPLYFTEGVENFRRPEGPEHFSIENVSHTFSDKVPRQKVRFWTGELSPDSCVRFELLDLKKINDEKTDEKGQKADLPDCSVKPDNKGWPCSVSWEKMKVPLIDGAMGDFISYSSDEFSPRWVFKDIFNTDDPVERHNKREKYLKVTAAEYMDFAQLNDTDHSREFYQEFTHPSLLFGIRKIVIFKNEPRVKFNIKICRKSSTDPEIFYLVFDLPCGGVFPWISNAGNPFRPETDQLEGSCMDYYAFDGWVSYETMNGLWIWSSADAPLITFGKPNAAARLESLPAKTDRILSMIFDNTWDTNFVCNSHGVMEFSYDIIWKERVDISKISDLVHGAAMEPVVVVKTGNTEEK